MKDKLKFNQLLEVFELLLTYELPSKNIFDIIFNRNTIKYERNFEN